MAWFGWNYADFQLSLTDQTLRASIIWCLTKITRKKRQFAYTMNQSNMQYQFTLGNELFFSGCLAGDGVMLISLRLGLTLVILQGGEVIILIENKNLVTHDCCSGGLGPGVHLSHWQHHCGGGQRRPVHLRGQQLGGTQGVIKSLNFLLTFIPRAM